MQNDTPHFEKLFDNHTSQQLLTTMIKLIDYPTNPQVSLDNLCADWGR
jgi:hypothetical protein